MYINLCVAASTQVFIVRLKDIFYESFYPLSVTPLTGKFVKSPKKCAIFDHMLLDRHKASFLILLKEKNVFKLQLKESLLIPCDKSIFSKNIYSFPLELFDCL